MNLYAIGWNLPKERYLIALAELRRMLEVYPKLDPETLWHRSSPCGTIFTALMHTADQAAAPRCYVTQSDDQVVFYSGLPVDPTGAYSAHRAEVLSAHWDQFAENLEGQYAIIRATDDPLRLELMTDFLGLEQVFYFHQGDMWLISNSVQLIERISKPSALDPLGVSLFLRIGWVGADRTLRRDIRVIPAGQHWIWQKGDIEPRRQSYYPPSRLARQPRRALTPTYLKRLADDLMQLCRSLSQGFEFGCLLTGGRDSRLSAALLIHAGLPVQYRTLGDPSSADVRIATLIAKTLDLPHEVISITESDVLEKWDELRVPCVRQTDGMGSLWEIASVLHLPPQFDRLDVHLHGVGGEIARGYYSRPDLFLSRHDVAAIQRALFQKLSRPRSSSGLIRREGVALAQDYVHRFVVRCVDEGFAPVDAPDLFWTYQNVSRRSGNDFRRMMMISDVFKPYCSRPFVEAAFAVPALQRCTEPLHYKLTRLLVPELRSVPYTQGPWRLQQPVMNLLYLYGTWKLRNVSRRVRRIPSTLRRLGPRKISKEVPVFDRSAWFEARREQIREICLDQRNSLLWSFVDRSMFERIMSPITDPAERSRHILALYPIATLFYYEADHQQCATPATPQK